MSASTIGPSLVSCGFGAKRSAAIVRIIDHRSLARGPRSGRGDSHVADVNRRLLSGRARRRASASCVAPSARDRVTWPSQSHPRLLEMEQHALRTGSRLVLVVDDDPKIVRLVRAYLEREGFAVKTASDGRTALQLVGDEMPDLIVLDLMLPELDGLSVARRVREESDVPILM